MSDADAPELQPDPRRRAIGTESQTGLQPAGSGDSLPQCASRYLSCCRFIIAADVIPRDVYKLSFAGHLWPQLLPR